ncbi:GNAT family N-acetyltransferase [Sediminitomix flava]|uniref:RimJ/RimL family protein N-acetyltransferase n=1 Tax=Sediminitomix flava TaxID=379075 RepID=A0A315ZA61_SEDFL|nr:GNAT family N-acetyltransferase [Sediminitomix flava]PWJ42476.1 RimJ/RimL family protein N-acetyltransferase [Sediminitomix flava]
MEKSYLFTSERLGFRNWQVADIQKMAFINEDPSVMKYFPCTTSILQTENFIARMQRLFKEKGYCYFAVDRLDSGEFIGFLGLCYQNFEAEFSPFVDIGWRLAQNAWDKGYATEGAKRCLQFAFEELNIQSVKSTAPLANERSIRVMKKIGMHPVQTFKHPRLKNEPDLEECVLYEIDKNTFLSA